MQDARQIFGFCHELRELLVQDEVYIIIPSTGFKLGLSLSLKILLRLGTERLIYIYLATTGSVDFIRQYIPLFIMQVITRVSHML